MTRIGYRLMTVRDLSQANAWERGWGWGVGELELVAKMKRALGSGQFGVPRVTCYSVCMPASHKLLAPAVRVLLISPRSLLRAGLALLLQGRPQIELAGQTDSLSSAAHHSFDVALFDTHGTRPLAVPFRLLILLTDTSAARAWIDAGAGGCVLETSPLEELLNAIRQVARGETFVPASVATSLVLSLGQSVELPQSPVEPLTERERDVLRLLVQGLGNKDIAQRLYLSVRTVEGHLANIYGKLQVKSRTEAALWAVQHGLVE